MHPCTHARTHTDVSHANYTSCWPGAEAETPRCGKLCGVSNASLAQLSNSVLWFWVHFPQQSRPYSVTPTIPQHLIFSLALATEYLNHFSTSILLQTLPANDTLTSHTLDWINRQTLAINALQIGDDLIRPRVEVVQLVVEFLNRQERFL